MQKAKNNQPKKQKKTKPNAQNKTKVVKAPVAMTRVVRTSGPMIKRSQKNGDVTVTHREYLRDINGSVPFTVTPIAVNPGLQVSFPWLSSMAVLFESYVFDKLEYEFQTEAPTSSTGTVMAALDYDAGDAAPVSKVQLAAYRRYVRSAPWNNFVQSSLSEDLHKRKSYYVRNGSLPANRDIVLYDVGNLYFATERQADTSVVGELYVSYTVRLMTPQLNDPAVGNALSSRYAWIGATVTTNAGSKAPLIPSGDSAIAYTLTATAPYAGLLVLVGVAAAGLTSFSTAGSTCTIQGAQQSSTATQTVYSAQVNFLPGQVFTAAPNVAQTQGNIQIGQYDTPVI